MLLLRLRAHHRRARDSGRQRRRRRRDQPGGAQPHGLGDAPRRGRRPLWAGVGGRAGGVRAAATAAKLMSTAVRNIRVFGIAKTRPEVLYSQLSDR